MGSFNLDYIELNTGDLPLSLITNPGFETGDISGWTEWHPFGQNPNYGVDSHDVHSGNFKCYFWNESPYQQSIHQIVTELQNGSYTLKAWVKATAYGSQPFTCRMEAINVGKEDIYYDIGTDGVWKQISMIFDITTGQIDIGFYINSPGRTSLQVDDVELIKN